MKDSSPIALISVTDKTDVVPFSQKLSQLGFTILSTGGTAQILREAGIDVFDAAKYADSPEIMDGRVKTLHPKIHGGILMDRSNPQHREEAKSHNIMPIDLVVVNLYQFKTQAVEQKLTLKDAIKFIDIGGPTMLRAAAKNYLHVAPVIDPKDYDKIIQELTKGELSLKTRQYLAGKAFSQISDYDRMIANYYLEEGLDQTSEQAELKLSLQSPLRYGENPHQKANFYTYSGAPSGLQEAHVLQGKELSYNNIIDVDAAAHIVADLADYTAVAIIKHTNPCGASASKTLSVRDVFNKALAADSKSAFGGIVACNRPVDGETAAVMSGIFLECVVAPSFTVEAQEIFSKKKNLRLLELPFLKHGNTTGQHQIKSVRGGILIQDADEKLPSDTTSWKPVTQTGSDAYTDDLVFAMTIAKHVKSNAIVFAKDLSTLAVGAGQMSRVDAAQFAALKAKEFGQNLEGAVMASDAFFPFRDTVDFAAKLGIKAIIQPGGSVRDQESIDACNENNIAMIFTGIRHFKH